MAIVPDGKDWTWVLHRRCPECGLDTRSVAREQVPGRIRANAASWRRVLAGRSAASLRGRPDDATWSVLEYACHVRDVYTLFEVRLDLMLTSDDPLFPNWDQDATAVEKDYPGQDPAQVSGQLVAAADRLAGRFAAVSPAAWSRTGRRSDGASFTVDTFARYLLHDPVHHLHDVGGAGPDGPDG